MFDTKISLYSAAPARGGGLRRIIPMFEILRLARTPTLPGCGLRLIRVRGVVREAQPIQTREGPPVRRLGLLPPPPVAVAPRRRRGRGCRRGAWRRPRAARVPSLSGLELIAANSTGWIDNNRQPTVPSRGWDGPHKLFFALGYIEAESPQILDEAMIDRRCRPPLRLPYE